MFSITLANAALLFVTLSGYDGYCASVVFARFLYNTSERVIAYTL